MKESEYLEMPWSIEDTIENFKEIKELMKIRCKNMNLDGKGERDAEEVEFDFDRAINALEKQEKIKAVFTHYAFSGNELDMCNDCISALSEIKAILKE